MIGKHLNEILNIYEAPFSHHCGYIHDANGKMVADDSGGDIHGIVQVRGWGHLSKLDDAEEVQDEIGEMIAEALTQYWKSMEGI